MAARQHWPERLWLVRHGQSHGNVARDAAHEAGLPVIDLELRDVDVPLSELGHRQAEATGRWFAALPEGDKPEVILSSPYVRSRQTAEAICEAGGLAGGAKPTVLDERLREREFGVFDGLTTMGIRQKYPEEASHRSKMGKFYHRPPGGESWADVILRLRSMLNTINLHYADKRVLVGIFAPGIVDTELNHDLRNGVPARRKLISPEESAAGIVALIAGLSKENQDRFQNYNGETFEW